MQEIWIPDKVSALRAIRGSTAGYMFAHLSSNTLWKNFTHFLITWFFSQQLCHGRICVLYNTGEDVEPPRPLIIFSILARCSTFVQNLLEPCSECCRFLNSSKEELVFAVCFQPDLILVSSPSGGEMHNCSRIAPRTLQTNLLPSMNSFSKPGGITF